MALVAANTNIHSDFQPILLLIDHPDFCDILPAANNEAHPPKGGYIPSTSLIA
jgi:hypothetical protein